MMRVLLIALIAIAWTNCCGWCDADNAPSASQPADASQSKANPGLAKRRAELRGYLQKQSGVRPEAPTVPLNKPADFWVAHTQYRAAKGDKKKLYGLISQHLQLAGILLVRENVEVQRSGLGVLLLARRCATDDLKDHHLATEICEAWMRPNLDRAHAEAWQYLSRMRLVEEIYDAYAVANRHPEAAEAAQLWIKTADNSNKRDAGRIRLAKALDKQGQTAEAIRVLEEVTDRSLVGIKSVIPKLREKLDKSPPAEAVKGTNINVPNPSSK